MKKQHRSSSKTGIIRNVAREALSKYNEPFDLVFIKSNQTIQVHIQPLEKGGWVADTMRE